MTIDEIRDYVLAALMTNPPEPNETIVWLHVLSNNIPKKFEVGRYDDHYIKDVWFPWILENQKAFSVVVAWRSDTQLEYFIETISANRLESYSINTIGKKDRHEPQFFTGRNLASYRRIITKNANQENV